MALPRGQKVKVPSTSTFFRWCDLAWDKAHLGAPGLGE